MNILFFFLFILTASILMALFEIQVEGKNGWAADLPTWRSNNKWLYKFMGNRPVTGYQFIFMPREFWIYIPLGVVLYILSLQG